MERSITRHRLTVENTVHIIGGRNQLVVDLCVIHQGGNDMSVRAFNEQFLGLQHDMDVVISKEGQQFTILVFFELPLRESGINLGL